MERLNKFLAHAGVASRRQCDELIASGRVKIDGRIVRDFGVKIDPEKNKVSVDDAPVKTEKPAYWVVNKPVGYLCTNNDPAGRPLAIDLVPKSEQRVYTVGRLDEASEGLLLMTNDGELAFQLMHPKFQIEKTYLVLVAGSPNREDEQKLLEGVWLSDGKVKAKRVRRIKAVGDSTWLRIVLCEGKNREIRRMLAKLGHKVMKLRRVAIGPIEIDRLPKGKARRLSLTELNQLKRAVEGSKKTLEQVQKRAATPSARPSLPSSVVAPKKPFGPKPPTKS
jgi:23S rRNA pseudouridine2605 synthase